MTTQSDEEKLSAMIALLEGVGRPIVEDDEHGAFVTCLREAHATLVRRDAETKRIFTKLLMARYPALPEMEAECVWARIT